MSDSEPPSAVASASVSTDSTATAIPSKDSSAKDAKAAAKAEKAARRAAAKGLDVGQRQTGGDATDTPNTPVNTTDPPVTASRHPKQNSKGSSGRSQGQASANAASSSSSGPPPTAASVASSTASLLNPPPQSKNAPAAASSSSSAELISTVHPSPSSAAFRSNLLLSSTYRGLHPSVILLMQHLAGHTLLGSSARAIATLAALRDFISDYKTPAGAVLNRDMNTKLGQQISGITSARPLGSSAGNAVRYLKYEISVVAADVGEAEAKAHLVDRIDHFIRDRIIFASRVISNHVCGKIRPKGDVLLTFARSSVVEQAIVDAWKKGKEFEVICVGGETFDEGKHLVSSLLEHGIPCSYAPLTSLSSVLPRVNLVLLGTASLLANGALYSRAGTATVAMMSHHRKVPVIVCCETYKFSERVRLEGVGGNERADPSPLLPLEDIPSNLSALNLLYDLTPPKYISAIASEVGLSGPESVAILLRDYKSILFGS